MRLIFICLVLNAFCLPGKSQQLAFPGADGFGKYATGGRGGKVLVVSNLNDDGPGSLREAIRQKGPRIITFSVSGTIILQSDLPVNNGDVTIAGQSAPGEGICIRNYPMRVSADNVIIRYMRFRLGDVSGTEDDAFKGRGADRVIIDHCSISWSTDECASFYGNSNFTMQWCIISESLNNSVHQKGAHGYGGIWGGKRASFHHNLLAHNNSRNPRFSGSSSTPNSPEELVDFTNNVIYNWKSNNVYGGEKGRYNMVNNYYKSGPASKNEDRIVNPSEPYGKFFVAGNYVQGYPQITADNWEGGIQCDSPGQTREEQPFEVEAVTTHSATEAYEHVLRHAGASFRRDEVDIRIVEDVRSGSATYGTGIINSQEDVGGWPELKSSPAPADADRDGMPDDWENSHGLDASNAADACILSLDKQYTNVEVYLNELVR